MKAPPGDLNLGEIFDRAVTLYARNFVIFTSIAFIAIAPVVILRSIALGYLADPDARFVTELAGALLINSAALFAGCIITARVAGHNFLPAARRGWSLLPVLLLVSVVMLTFDAVLGVIFALRDVLLANVLGGISIAALVVLAVALRVLAVAGVLALYSIILEGKSGVAALVLSARRVLSRREIRFAALIALALLAVDALNLLGTLGLGFLRGSLLRNAIVYAAILLCMASLFSAFVATMLAVYYFVVRARREGDDLEAGLDSLAARS